MTCCERQLELTGENSRDDQPFDIGTGGFIVFGVGAVVADLRVGQDDDLARVGRIGKNFLIAGEEVLKTTSP